MQLKDGMLLIAPYFWGIFFIMDITLKKELIAYLSQYVTENKKEKIDSIVKDRTRHFSIVLEDVFQSYNASAIIRSAECFGVQDIHIVEKLNKFDPCASISKGASKWIDFYRYKKIDYCVKDLKEKGYKIVATTPHTKSCFLHELDIKQKTALVFGNEAVGLSKKALDLADEFVTIPMVGFTESFNISVSVAICLYDIIQRLRSSNINWRLSEQDTIDVMLSWIKKVVPASEALERKFLEDKN